MKMILSQIFAINILILCGFNNLVNNSDGLSNLDNIDFKDSIIIDVRDYDSLDDLYPVMSNPIVINDLKYDAY